MTPIMPQPRVEVRTDNRYDSSSVLFFVRRVEDAPENGEKFAKVRLRPLKFG